MSLLLNSELEVNSAMRVNCLVKFMGIVRHNLRFFDAL